MKACGSTAFAQIFIGTLFIAVSYMAVLFYDKEHLHPQLGISMPKSMSKTGQAVKSKVKIDIIFGQPNETKTSFSIPGGRIWAVRKLIM